MGALDSVYFGVLLLSTVAIIYIMLKGLRLSERLNDEQREKIEKKSDDAVEEAPDGYFRLGNFEVMTAERMLKQFEESGVRFQLEKVEKQVYSGGGSRRVAGYRTVTSFDIFVAKDDEQKAVGIHAADWKV